MREDYSDGQRIICEAHEINRLKAEIAQDLPTKDQLANDLRVEIERWKKAVEGLTPGGSEYVNNPERCAEYIRQKATGPIKLIGDLKNEINRLKAELIATQEDHFKLKCTIARMVKI